ncbi:MAG: BlaI/MecI/CopY family transcriptional regulator [Bryobacteraceae bacterium]|nr:BlaI/MecI/CopY family transcriptional regulator [Bryobacteraceae bacterium]MDW8378334.1 BlaI/MecI/CopY family transcriptional regulator [Bryobacterales bacterium]
MRTRPPKGIPPPMELECLKALWKLGEGNVRSVQQELAPRYPLAYTTVMTLLERLTKRGGLSRRRQGRSFIYTPLVDRDTVRRRAVRELLVNLFEGSPQLLVSFLQNTAAGSWEATDSTPREERLDTALL